MDECAVDQLPHLGTWLCTGVLRTLELGDET